MRVERVEQHLVRQVGDPGFAQQGFDRVGWVAAFEDAIAAQVEQTGAAVTFHNRPSLCGQGPAEGEQRTGAPADFAAAPGVGWQRKTPEPCGRGLIGWASLPQCR